MCSVRMEGSCHSFVVYVQYSTVQYWDHVRYSDSSSAATVLPEFENGYLLCKWKGRRETRRIAVRVLRKQLPYNRTKVPKVDEARNVNQCCRDQ